MISSTHSWSPGAGAPAASATSAEWGLGHWLCCISSLAGVGGGAERGDEEEEEEEEERGAAADGSSPTLLL